MLYCEPGDNKNIKIGCFTDNHQLYDSVYSIRPTQNKHEQNCIIMGNDQQKRAN